MLREVRHHSHQSGGRTGLPQCENDGGQSNRLKEVRSPYHQPNDGQRRPSQQAGERAKIKGLKTERRQGKAVQDQVLYNPEVQHPPVDQRNPQKDATGSPC